MDNLGSGELLQNNQNNAMEDLAHRMSNPKLMALRAQHPFIPILPFPNESRTYALSANVAQDINLPSGCKMVMFSGNGEYYISRKGKAEVPSNGSNVETGSVMNPEFCFWYVEEINQLSAVAPVDCRLTVHCFTQL